MGSSGFAGIFGADPVHTIVPLCNESRPRLKDGLKTAATSAGLQRIAHDSTAGAAYQRMHATLDSLGMIIGTLEHFPGRKTVILFSEGLATSEWVNDNRRDHFDRLMAQANRAHVAFYTFDAAGLRTKSLLTSVTRSVRRPADDGGRDGWRVRRRYERPDNRH